MRQIVAAAGQRPVSRRTLPAAGTLAIALGVFLTFAPGRVAAAPSAVSGGIRFTYAEPGAAAVYWTGEFNDWNATAMPMARGEGGVWTVVIALPAGEHQYKFVADGQYFADPGNPVTAGDFGNSVVVVGPEGRIAEMKATSNTPYSPKIFMGGRVIGLYVSAESRENERFELRRPNMDIDLNLDIRISDMLQAAFLMNINSETENVEAFRSRLNFDRGHLLLTQPNLEIYGWDNESAGTWDDPLHLVGNVGIYNYGFGYDRQGFRVRPQMAGFETELLYADNFEPGGTVYPGLPATATEDQITGMAVMPSGSGYAVAPGFIGYTASTSLSDANEDAIALRTRREVVDGLKLGLLGRSDRGFNLSTIRQTRVTGDSSLSVLGGDFEQAWFAGGADLRWRSPWNAVFQAEYLRGTLRLTGVKAFRETYHVTSADSTGPTSTTLTGADDANGDHLRLDDSNRLHVGATWTAPHGDITVRGSLEYEDHDYGSGGGGLQNSMSIWRAGWDRNWRYYLNREVKTTLDLEYTAFDYDATTPWRNQLWFPTANFWLESGEHVASFDRLTLLGGNDVVSWKPSLFVPVLAERNVTFEYAGTFNGVDFGKLPRYAESIFRLGADVTPRVRFSTDSRWVKYDHPGLGLFSGYVSHFADLTYQFAPGIQISLSAGVDPSVIDGVTNEYDGIGRDLFLFDRGANGSRAETNYFSLGAFDGLPGMIDQAERALEKERRVQVEAIVRF